MGGLDSRRTWHQFIKANLLHNPDRHRQRLLAMFGLGRLPDLLLGWKSLAAKAAITRMAVGRVILVRHLALLSLHLRGRIDHPNQRQARGDNRPQGTVARILQLFRGGHRCQDLLLCGAQEAEE